ncbi:MAG: LysR substrate-binding domain-containing protein [Geminicoccaceae bacterium]
MNQAQLKAFHAVAEEGGFTVAAARLGVTQPAVTVQVKALEAHYQVELFHRRPRQALLTAVGRELYQLTQRMVALEGQAETLLETEGGLGRGRLVIAADGPFHILPFIQAIRAELPSVSVRVSTGNSAFVRQALLDYQAEIGVLSEHGADQRFTVLASKQHAVILMIPAEHPWAGRPSISLAELEGVPMVLREKGSATRRRFEEALEAGNITPEIVLEIGSREAVREAVATGIGLGVIQEPEFGNDPRLVGARIKEVGIIANEYIVCLTERQNSWLLSALKPLLRQ